MPERPGRALEADDVGLVTGQARPGGGGPDDGSAWLAAVSRERSAGAVLRPRLGSHPDGTLT